MKWISHSWVSKVKLKEKRKITYHKHNKHNFNSTSVYRSPLWSVLESACFFSNSWRQCSLDLLFMCRFWAGVTIGWVLFVWYYVSLESHLPQNLVGLVFNQQVMVKRLLPAHPVLLFHFETLSNELPTFFRHMRIEIDTFCHDIVD